MEKGIKSLSMDDIARDLHVSKKTLYQICDNKPDLVKLVMQFQMDCDKKRSVEFAQDALDAVHEIILVMKSVTEHMRTLNPITLNDIQRYYPESWEVFKSFRFEFVYHKMLANLTRGVKEGVYRKSLNPDIIARLYVAAIDNLFNPQLFPAHDYYFVDVYRQFLEYHLRGIATARGIDLIENYSVTEKKLPDK